MRKKLLDMFKRNEIYLVSVIIAVVFVAAMAVVAWMLRTSILTPPYEALSEKDLKRLYATAYLRFREDDGTPYLKVELHNGTLWWIKKIEFNFDGTRYALSDPHAFRPLRFGALRCILKQAPPNPSIKEYDLRIAKAFGYPPATDQPRQRSNKVASGASEPSKD